MTNKPRYQRIISLNEEDQKKIDKLQAKGIKVVDIFRKGMESYCKEVK